MNKISKTILIISIAVFGAGFLLVNPVYANDNLVVEVWNESLSKYVSLDSSPLFSEANFLPGDSVNRLVKVTNNSEKTQKIGVKIIDNSGRSTDCLSDVLDLAISKGGSTLYSGSLTSFYEAGEKPLSDLGAGGAMIYQFSITFRPPAGDKYQNSSANFDIKIGFFGEEAIGEEISPGAVGGGGSVILPGLRIYSEKIIEPGTNSVTITWDTNFLSTSRVIYSPKGLPHILEPNNPPNYGYVFSTEEDSAKVLDHSVNITGLLPGTTYYFRCVSHASPPTISREHSFTTLTLAEGEREEGVEEEEEEEEEEEISEEETEEGIGEEEEEEEEEEGEEEGEIAVGEEKEEKEKGGRTFLATIGQFFSGLSLKSFFFIALVLLIILLILLIFYRRRKKRALGNR